MDKRLEALDRFLEILDRIEESENGVVFHPVQISCCRTSWLDELDSIMRALKKNE